MPCILVVDLDPAFQQRMTARFGERGYCIEFAGSGADAIAAVRDGGYDVLVTEVRMPALGGVEIASLARTAHSGLAVVAMSDDPLDAADVRVFDAVLVRPFTLQAARHVFDGVVNGSRPL